MIKTPGAMDLEKFATYALGSHSYALLLRPNVRVANLKILGANHAERCRAPYTRTVLDPTAFDCST